jgi:hypothetical protein
MLKVQNFYSELERRLPTTLSILQSSNLTVHENVSSVILHGSRCLPHRFRVDSDIDLSLVVKIPAGLEQQTVELLPIIFETTMTNWKSDVELDLAVVFDIKHCQLRCFEQSLWDDQLCTIGGRDCFGLYKIGKGFNGIVNQANIQVPLMYPCLKIWDQT